MRWELGGLKVAAEAARRWPSRLLAAFYLTVVHEPTSLPPLRADRLSQQTGLGLMRTLVNVAAALLCFCCGEAEAEALAG